MAIDFVSIFTTFANFKNVSDLKKITLFSHGSYDTFFGYEKDTDRRRESKTPVFYGTDFAPRER